MINFKIKNIKKIFPIFLKNKNLCFLDNATTTHKPIQVIYSELKFYSKYYSSSNKSIYTLDNKITFIINYIRKKIAKFFLSKCYKEIIFVKGSTEAINLIVNSWALNNLNENDNIIITEMEHHSNIIPWIILSKKINIKIKVIPISYNGKLNLKKLKKLLDENTKVVSLTYVSNVLGTINPLKKIINYIKKYNKNIFIIIDGAQSYCFMSNLKKLNFDCYYFSAHKMYGPTGIGILYVKKKILKKMIPWQGGGGIIKNLIIKKKKIEYIDYPWKFEPGTLNISGIIGMYLAIKFIKKIGFKNYLLHENELTKYLIEKLITLKFIKIYGIINNNNLNNRRGIISFNVNNYHPYDIGNLLNNYNICIRTGHLCCIPIMHYYKVSSMCRISLAIYNNFKDIDYFIDKLIKINKLLK